MCELFYITTFDSFNIYAFPSQVDLQAVADVTFNHKRENCYKMPSEKFQMPSASAFNTFLEAVKVIN